VIVSSSECTESLYHSKSPSLQPQQLHQETGYEQHQQLQQDLSQSQQHKTFFTTLNQPEQRNINEFINSCENNDGGINFFQDSELQSRQLEQQHADMNFQQQQAQPQEQFNQQRNLKLNHRMKLLINN